MSDVNRLDGAGERLFLLPNQLKVVDRFNIRRYQSEATIAKETEDLTRLGKSLAVSQLDDLLAYEENGEYVLFAGHRRRAAAIMENERRSASGQSLIRLRVRIVEKSADVLQQAIQSNVQRKNLSYMHEAELYKRLMEENGWTGWPGVKKVAAYVGVSAATVSDRLKFNDAPHDIKEMLALDLISADSALKLMAASEGDATKAGQLIDEARKQQVEAAEKKAAAEVSAGMKSQDAARKDVEAAAKGPIQAPAVSKTIRAEQDKKVEDGSSKPVRRTVKEILEWVESLMGPAYGHPDSAVRLWAEKFSSFVMGETSEKTMQKAFDFMVEKAHPGTKEASEKERQREEREALRAEKEAARKEKEKEKAREEKRKEKEKEKEAQRAAKEAEKQKAAEEKAAAKAAELAKKEEEKQKATAEKEAQKAAKAAEKAQKEAERKAAADAKIKAKLEELEQKRLRLLEGKQQVAAEGKQAGKQDEKQGKGKAAAQPKSGKGK